MAPVVHQIADEALGNTSYLVEIGDGKAIAVDPRRDVGEHFALAARRAVEIVASLETHLHADFVSGSRELAEAVGAEIVAAEEAGLTFPHRSVVEEDRFSLGSVSIEVLATPGHTPAHVAYLISDGAGRALFSGGSLIVGGAARTDLSGPERTTELARAQYASLHRLAALPGDTSLFPTHGGGSFCSTGRARTPTSTIGAERASNQLLMPTDEEPFVDALLAGFGSYPRYFASLGELNRRGAPPLGSFASLPELDGLGADEAVARGAWLIDGRAVNDWARSHAEGSVSIAVRPAFASWLGWLVPFGDPVVFVLEPGRVAEAVRLARRLGYDRLEGWVRFEAWRDAGLPVSSIETVSAEEARERGERGAVLLDVRQHAEFATRRLPGAVHLELGDIIAGKTPDAAEVITHCGRGERSATAASLLARRGVKVANLAGGTSAWHSAGFPFEQPS